MSLPIEHIGTITPLCGAVDVTPRFRDDLGYHRYLRLGRTERFKNEKPYRICLRCLASIRKETNRMRAALGKKPLK